MQFGTKKIIILEDIFSLLFSQFKKYRPSGSLKFNNLGIFQSFKLRDFMGKILRISLKLNFTSNTLVCYGLISHYESRTGKEKVIANEEKRRRGPERDAHYCSFKDSVFYVPGLNTISAKKQTKTTTWFFVRPPSPPPSWLTWSYKELPLSPQRTTWFVYCP